MKRNFWETHLYTYAVACIGNGSGLSPQNFAGMRAKALKYGHTLGEVMCVERNPMPYLKTGKVA
jgi:hypothetical protein